MGSTNDFRTFEKHKKTRNNLLDIQKVKKEKKKVVKVEQIGSKLGKEVAPKPASCLGFSVYPQQASMLNFKGLSESEMIDLSDVKPFSPKHYTRNQTMFSKS